ncbi:hypothetical protein CQY20_19290 [Mycolicibacterium agri]|uniref:Uncharacterized protein n=1 Tax=Mycolicibacterium agri TaxID=36811 RepID=A0A2A7MYZ0_MYCAG|nr:DUF6390 family protein [Mycolicibacterium agri]PEG36378.1 hypothetical protein CQY20_19290 [Mycolicibacterium agri]GFG49586.1 hypothetical protein MAGR_10270 [Mycolicibacterium agri]
MTTLHDHMLPAGYALFARYAFPPNELGYCGPAEAEVLLRGDNPAAVAEHAKAFDGAWPYLHAIAEAAGIADPLDAEVVHDYWIGGPLLGRVDPAHLVANLRRAFAGQVTGLLADPGITQGALAHHSFQVLVVYPWVRFLDRDAATALKVLQDCRIRWGTVESVDNEHVWTTARALTYADGVLALGEPRRERVRWRKDGVSLIEAPRPGDVVSAHWDWTCGVLTDAECVALADSTQTTLDLVNAARTEERNR